VKKEKNIMSRLIKIFSITKRELSNESMGFLINIILLLAIGTIDQLPAQEKYTQYKIKAGGFLNGNMYSSDFKELKGYPTGCETFDFAFGIGYGAFIGAEYLFEDEIYGFKTSADILLSYQDLSARYSIEEKFANIIIGNDYVQGIVEHNLDPVINAIMIEPGFHIYPVDKLPLSIRLGFHFLLNNN